jgi:hypothetical protein
MASDNGTDSVPESPLADLLLDLIRKVGYVCRGLDILADHFARHLETNEALTDALKAVAENQKTLSRRVTRALKRLERGF